MPLLIISSPVLPLNHFRSFLRRLDSYIITICIFWKDKYLSCKPTTSFLCINYLVSCFFYRTKGTLCVDFCVLNYILRHSVWILFHKTEPWLTDGSACMSKGISSFPFNFQWSLVLAMVKLYILLFVLSIVFRNLF